MNADENKMLIGVHLRSSAAHSIRYDDHEESRLRAEPLSSGAGGEFPDPVRNPRPCSRRFRALSGRRPPAFAFRSQAAAEAARREVRETGMLRAPGSQERREAGPSTWTRVPGRCLPALPA